MTKDWDNPKSSTPPVPLKGNAAFIQGFARDSNPYAVGTVEYFAWDGAWLVYGREVLKERKCLDHIPINMIEHMLDAYSLGLSHWSRNGRKGIAA